MTRPGRLTDRYSLKCRDISRHKSSSKGNSTDMFKALILCFMVTLLCSPILCKKEVPQNTPGQITHDGIQVKSVKSVSPLDSDGKEVRVSSAVENAKRILGIDVNARGRSPPSSPKSARDTRKLLDKIKKEFKDKILDVAAERINIGKSSKENLGAEKLSNDKLIVENIKGQDGKVTVKDAEIENKRLVGIEEEKSNLPNTITNELNQFEDSGLIEVKHDESVVSPVETSPPLAKVVKSSIAKPKGKDLPERSKEYVKAHLIKGAKEEVGEEEKGGKEEEKNSPLPSSIGDVNLEVNAGDALVDDGGLGRAKSRVDDVVSADVEDVENDSGDLPPNIGSKLGQDVVNDTKFKAHTLSSNSTTNPSQLFDSHGNLFTDDGHRTLSRFSDPKNFFTNLSNRSIVEDKTSSIKTTGGIMTWSHSNASDFKKIIIVPQIKTFHTDDGNEKTSLSRDGKTKKIAITPPVEKQKSRKTLDSAKERELGDHEDREESEAKHVQAKEKHDEQEGSSHERESLEDGTGETSTPVTILPTTVVRDSEEKLDNQQVNIKSPKDEESVKVEEQTKLEESKNVEEGKQRTDEGHVTQEQATSSENKEGEKKMKDKLEKDTIDNIEEKVETDAQKEEIKEETQQGKEDKIDKVEDKDEASLLKVDKGKETLNGTGKVEEDELEKKEKSITDTEEEASLEKEEPLDTKQDKKAKAADDDSAGKPKSKEDGGKEAKTGDEKTEDMLETYSQFTQRVSAEKKIDATNGHGTNGHSKGSKVKGKNYASPDCGAKLVTSNPEASHSSKVIHPNKDEYMLNKCRDKIWFVIELCESIRPQKFDIANFELFSNLPKDIQVLGSHRYPSRDWTSLGWFKGQEGNRGVQSFRVDTEDFFKYIKVEVTSNYGSEFYCPISTFQIYGLSEFEVIDTIEDPADDTDDDNEPDIDQVADTTIVKKKEGGIPLVLQNMFSGMLDVIKRGYRPSSSASEPGEDCYSLHPTFAVESEVCPMAGSLNYILSCYKMEYDALMQQPFVSSTVKNSSFCRQLALTMCAEPEVNDSIVYDTTCNNSYVCVMLSPKHVLAMCFMQDPQIMDKGISCESGSTISENYSATSDLSLETPTYIKNADINTSRITRSDAIETNFSESVDLRGKISTPEVIEDNVKKKKKESADISRPEKPITENVKASPKELNGNTVKVPKEGEQKAAAIHVADPEEKLEIEGSGYAAIDIPSSEEDHLSPVEETTQSHPSPPTASSSTQLPELKVPISPTNKESVVVRLSNKIKVLEYNMSISSQYLEELSRRYKRQMEDMQRQFNITMAARNEAAMEAYERDKKHIDQLEEHLANVSSILQKLVDERETLATKVVEQHVMLMVVEVIVLCVVFTMCSRGRTNNRHHTDYAQTRTNLTPSEDPSDTAVDHDANCHPSDSQGRLRVRRRSVDSITSDRKSRLRRRRPSEEALNISGTYQDLLIIEPAIPILMDSVERKKKRKSSNGTLKRSKSNASIVDKSSTSRKTKRIAKLDVSSAGVLFCGDEVDSEMSVRPGDSPAAYGSDCVDFYGLVHDPSSCDQSGQFYDNAVVNSNYVHHRSMMTDIPFEKEVSYDFESLTKRHSVSCFNCDSVHKKGAKLSKSISLGSGSEKSKSSTEKTKKVKKQKKTKIVTDPVILQSDLTLPQGSTPTYNNDYYYPKPNGISYCSPIGTYGSFYYNGHNTVHFCDDANQHRDPHSYSCTEDVAVNGVYSNGIDTSGIDIAVPANEQQHTIPADKKKLSPKVKSKGKLRSDNWEWYSTQHVGNSSSETVSTCSDSSGINRKVIKEEQVDVEKRDEKRSKKKKKSKSKSSVLFEEEPVLEAEAGRA